MKLLLNFIFAKNQIDRYMDWIDGQMEGWKDGQMGRWIDGQINKWIDGQIDRWIDGQCEKSHYKQLYVFINHPQCQFRNDPEPKM